MPEPENQVTQEQVEEAARKFYDNFLKLVQFHDRITELWAFRDRNAEYDRGLRDLIDRQKKLMFELRNLYVDAYDLLPEEKRAAVFRWIVQATGELKNIDQGVGALGIAPLIIVAGVVIAAATGTALVAWHREISNQEQALANQAAMIPLVEKGIVPAEVLKPVEPAGLGSVLGNLGTVALVIALIWAGVKVFGGSD